MISPKGENLYIALSVQIMLGYENAESYLQMFT
jgi:hypothetical protein